MKNETRNRKDKAGSLVSDQHGWIDFTLSKAALMITSIVILAAFYQIGADLSDIQVQKQLDSESIELKAAIDDIGSVSPDSIRQSSTYEFSTDFPANAFISGEYIRFETTYLDKTVHSVKPLTFRTLAHNETEMRKLLSNNFNGQTGTAEDPITTDTNTALELLSSVSRQELMLNTEKIVHIEKTSIYLKNDPEVRQLEIVLVYQ
ncbi:hypothetical protein [Methanococcoides methylutens]|nr:hypothetical protein [Methanococcoides methylutens]